MLRFLVSALCFAALPTTALAADVGVGATVRVRSPIDDLSVSLPGYNYKYYYGSYTESSTLTFPSDFGTPTLDLTIDDTVIQVHVLDTIANLVQPEIDPFVFGVNAFYSGWDKEIGAKGRVAVFAGAGGSLDLVFIDDDNLIQAGVIAPVGLRFGESARFAAYAVPEIALIGGGGRDVNVVVPPATFLLSAWF